MIKKYCDVCKREIDAHADRVRPFYYARAWELDMCEDCKEKWNDFKVDVQKKYEKLQDELYAQQAKEICDFLGLPEDEFHKDRRTMELDEEE